MGRYWILMGDIVQSRRARGNELAGQFGSLIAYLNRQFAATILSPLTITLGDEFQGVVQDKKTGVAIILEAERYIMANSEKLTIRFVLNYGEIETPVNRQIAHGMLGSGLSATRELINHLKSIKERYWIGEEGKASEVANQLFYLYDTQVSNWKGDDKKLAALFLELKDYKKVAAALGKNQSLMWKRERSLKIRAFETITQLIQKLA
ncbi:MAG: SatD family protein [Chitinophagaceae bacterium]|nr:SatD family protein [Chitinophagaceae bacterium]